MFRVERKEVAGDYVELGTAPGGTAILLCSYAQRSKFNRQIWLFDAFEDFSPPTSTYREVSNLLYRQLQFDRNKVHIVKGFFHNTLSRRPALPIALLHIDASGYETVKEGLDKLYNLVAAGGWLVFDNYWIDEGARRAVDEHLETCKLTGRLEGKSNNQVYFKKPAILNSLVRLRGVN